MVIRARVTVQQLGTLPRFSIFAQERGKRCQPQLTWAKTNAMKQQGFELRHYGDVLVEYFFIRD
jgi:N-formylglutamate amidohydrolase